MRKLALAAVLLTACPAPDPTHGLQSRQSPDQVLDHDEFVCNVMPILVRRCSYLGCHGVNDHALRIYSPGKLRIGDPVARADREAPLTADEVERNFQSATGLVYAATPQQRAAGDLTRVPLLSKPTAARVGGGEHLGVAVFPVAPALRLEDDAEWKTLTAWVAGKQQPSPPDADCAAFFTSLGLTPKGRP